MKENNKIRLRIPRPIGYTYLCQEIHKSQDKDKQEDLRKELIRRTIEIYVNNNLQWMGKQMNVTEFATYLNIDTRELLMRMNKEFVRIGNFFDDEKGQAFARAQLFAAIKKGLEISAQVEAQAHVLGTAQGNKYVPFLSSAVNQALGNLINSQRPIHDLLKLITDKSPTNPFINTDGSSSTSGAKYLTPETAIKLINNGTASLLNDSALLAAKAEELKALPDVNARNQDLTSIGVRKADKKAAADTKEGIENRHTGSYNPIEDEADFTA